MVTPAAAIPSAKFGKRFWWLCSTRKGKEEKKVDTDAKADGKQKSGKKNAFLSECNRRTVEKVGTTVEVGTENPRSREDTGSSQLRVKEPKEPKKKISHCFL